MTNAHAIAESEALRDALQADLEVLNGSEHKSQQRSLAIAGIQQAVTWLTRDVASLRGGAVCHQYDPHGKLPKAQDDEANVETAKTGDSCIRS